MDSDRVVVLDDGRVTENDAPDVLLEKDNVSAEIFYGTPILMAPSGADHCTMIVYWLEARRIPVSFTFHCDIISTTPCTHCGVRLDCNNSDWGP